MGITLYNKSKNSIKTSVADTALDPDPHVFGPGSGSGSFYHHANIVRKTCCFVTSLLLSRVPLKKVISKKTFFVAFWSRVGFGSEVGSISQRYGSAVPDPDPYQNVTDPQHCLISYN